MSDRAFVLDLEACGVVDLRKSGVHRYAQDPDTDVICWAWQILKRNNSSAPWGTSGSVISASGAQSLSTSGAALATGGGYLIVAHNVAFERAIWREILTPRYHWPECPPLEMWRDTMAMASYWGLPAGLGDACDALRLPITKDRDARKLMLQMARPRSLKPGMPIVWWHKDDPEKLRRLRDYCAQDVAAEAALFCALPMLPPREQAIWHLDQEINDRGIGLDVGLVNRMRKVAGEATAKLDARMAQLTVGAVKSTRQVGPLLAHLQYDGYPGQDLTRPTIEKALAGKLGWISSHVKALLRLRADASRSSVAKLESMLAYLGVDRAVMRGLLQYYGAMRTGRWAGRGPQPQNFPRPEKGLDVDLAVRLLKQGATAEALDLFVGFDPLTVLAACLRGCMVAPDSGDVIVAADYSQIEARITAWMANEQHVLDVFRRGEDLYVATAAKLGSTDRQFGKLMALSCGFQTGGPKLQVTAEDQFKIILTLDDANEAVRDWRDAHPKTVGLWWSLDAAAHRAVREPGRWWAGSPECEGPNHVSFRVEKGNLYMKLPSGRMLTYRDVELQQHHTFNKESVTFMGIDQYTRKWERQFGYGGMWTNNAVQGTARDFMAEAMLNLRPAPSNLARGAAYRPLVVPRLSVHDELVCSASRAMAQRALAHLIEVMSRPPAWAPSVPIAVSGYVSPYFKKG